MQTMPLFAEKVFGNTSRYPREISLILVVKIKTSHGCDLART